MIVKFAAIVCEAPCSIPEGDFEGGRAEKVGHATARVYVEKREFVVYIDF